MKQPILFCTMILIMVITVEHFVLLHEITVFSPPEPVASQVNSPSDTPDAPALLYRVTAYCPGPCCCGKWADGYTASGKRAVGLIVAAPPEIPFGTVLAIPGYGCSMVEDRGGAITGNRLDILMKTHAEAKEWGVQWLMVKEVK